MIDLLLAVAHHLAVFGLVAVMAMEAIALRGPAIDTARLARLDARFGGVAGLALFIGVLRVVWGGKGWAFYESNPFFWAKIGLFAAIGLLSIGPTILIIRWRRAAASDPAFAPPTAELKRARVWVGLEVLLLVLLLACAAAMARWPF